MKKFYSKICIFLSITLLFFSISSVFADETTEEEPQESPEMSALKNITEGMEIIGFEQVIPKSEAGGKEDIKINQRYFFRLDSSKFGDNTSDTTVKVNGKKYKLCIGLRSDDGIVPIAEGVHYNGDAGDEVGTGAFVAQVSDSVTYNSDEIDAKKDFEGKPLVYYLVDENGNIVSELDAGNYQLPKKMIQATPEERKSIWGAVWDLVTGDPSGIGKILTQSIVAILLPLGDSFLHMLSRAVGEVVTIDRIVFGEVNKLSIDFFDDLSEGFGNSNVVPLRAPLVDVINVWYGFFLKIAILFYMTILVYMGLRILLASTGNKKAEYKTRLVAWTMGVVMLLCFPYVMKYTIQANQALCQWIGVEISGKKGASNPGGDYNIADVSLYDMRKDYGKYSFIAKAMGYVDFKALEDGNGGNTFGNNVMLSIRLEAQMWYNLPLTIVYLIMLAQTLALTILYYKRVFMLAFLITIFPLAAMFYTLNKTGDLKVNSFGEWFKEFAVNVFVQVFHAVTYVTVVKIGISAYRLNGDWMFFLLCVLFLFEGEKIIRAIFNAKSSTGTIGDMAMAGAMAFSILKKTADTAGKLTKGKEDKSDDDDDSKKDKIKDKAKGDMAKANQEVNKNTQTQGAEKNEAAAKLAAKGNGQNGASGELGTHDGSESQNSAGGNTEIRLGREPNTTHEELYNKVNKRIEEIASTGASKVGKVLAGIGVGATRSIVSYTFSAAQTKDMKTAGGAIGAGLNGASAGFEMGGNIVDSIHNSRQNRIIRAQGLALAEEYMNGDHDDDFVINEADEQLRKKKLEAYRKIAARVATERAKYGKGAAEKVVINESLDTK